MRLTEPQFDTKAYARLLSKAHPGVIKSDAENDRLLGIVENLMAKGETRLSAEEEALLELLLNLIHAYEQQRYPIPPSPPHEIVSHLMAQRGLSPADLVPLLGGKGRVSEVLSGKRGVSKEQAKRLAAFFEVGVELFL